MSCSQYHQKNLGGCTTQLEAVLFTARLSQQTMAGGEAKYNMKPHNLSSSIAMVLWEAWRQLNATD